ACKAPNSSALIDKITEGWGLLVVFVMLDMDPEGAFGIGVHYGKFELVVIYNIAPQGYVAQRCCKPTTNSVVVVVGYSRGEVSVKLLDSRCPRSSPAIIASLEYGFLLFLVVFVFDISNDLLQYIFHGYQACGAAMLIDYDGKMVATDSKVVQEHIKMLGLRHKYCWPD